MKREFHLHDIFIHKNINFFMESFLFLILTIMLFSYLNPQILFLTRLMHDFIFFGGLYLVIFFTKYLMENYYNSSHFKLKTVQI